MSENLDDTIVAVSTPPGEGGIGIVRMSGPDAFTIARGIFARARKNKKIIRICEENFVPQKRRLYYGYILNEAGREMDEVLISFMPAPYTYTCEDVVEINAHGGIIPLGNILNLIMGMGVRLAEPGEFTKRAFINGRIDLVQAESVLAVINAKTSQGLQSSLLGLKGYLSREIKEMSDELLSLRAAIEADSDFPLEDVEMVDYGLFRERLANLRDKAASMHRRSKKGRILQDGLQTVIVGKPNVGKSSLYNYLLKEERAIVTNIPGTTRDLLTDYVNINGVPLKLVDTAGLRRDGEEVEKIGMEYSRKAITTADLIIFMLDLSAAVDEEDMWIFKNLSHNGKGKGLIIVGNKIDRGIKVTEEVIERNFPGYGVIKTSVATGKGLDKLEQAIMDMVFTGQTGGDEGALVMAARQGALIEKLVSGLEDAVTSLNNNLPLDLVSIDLQQAYGQLQNLLGEELPADTLDYIFSNFCIGK